MDRNDLEVVRSLPGNDKCFDCCESDAQWASVSYGTVFCIECSGKRRALGVHVDFVRSLTLDTWKPEHVAVMKAGGNAKCFRAFRLAKVPMAVTEGGGRNSLENNSQDFQERYNHPGAKNYKQQLLNEAVMKTKTGEPSGSDSSTENMPSIEKERIYELARLDPDIPWHLPVPFVLYKVLFLAIRIGFGIPALPMIVVFCLLRFVVYPDSATVQGFGWLLATLPTIGMVLFGRKLCRDFTQGRIPPFKSAQNLLAERLIEGRAIRTRGYDVFLPSTESNDDTNKRVGLILYPGWLINHTAYAPIASKLSDKGILVVVMSMEPFRASVESTKRETQRFLHVMYELLTEVAPNHPVSEWAVGGHSVGAHLAMKIAKATSPGTSKLVLWGCGSRPIDHRSSFLGDNETIEVLVLNGSEDASINQLSFSEKQNFRNMLPGSDSSVYRTIAGGNHNGFGHYEKPKNKKRDGIRTITLDEQQGIAAEETSNFLRGRKAGPLPTRIDTVIPRASNKDE